MVAYPESVGSLVQHVKRLYRKRLFNSSRIHCLDSSASDFRTEHDCYIDVFFKHRWYSENYKLDGDSLIQASNTFMYNFRRLGVLPGLKR